MGSPPFRVSCPTCETALRPHLTESVTVEEANTLRGRGVTCRACDTEFEVLFYPE